jgi:hypothetical protein
MYGFKGGFTFIGSPNSSFRAAGNSFSSSPRNRMLNLTRPSLSSVPPSDHMHEKKNTPCMQEHYTIQSNFITVSDYMSKE